MAAAQSSVAGKAGATVKIPFRMRLKAWWDGNDLEVRRKQRKTGAGTASAAAPVRPPYERWNEAHLELLNAVWGEGRVTPGGDDYILHLVKPFGLNPAMSLLDLGAGLGGASRLMAETFGVWVTGVERVQVLAEAGMEISKQAGLEKKAPINVFDPDKFDMRAKSFDCIFSKEMLFTMENKERVLQMIELMLKDQGQFLFTDYIVDPAVDTGALVEAWSKDEPDEPFLLTADDYQRALTEMKLEIRISEDITTEFRDLIVQRWTDYISQGEGKGVDDRLASALVEEVELWTRRVQILDSGALKLYRFYTLKKTRSSLLSDW